MIEKAYPLIETEEMNYEIFKRAYKSIKKDGKFIFITLNGLFPLFQSIDSVINQMYNYDAANVSEYDLMTFRNIKTINSSNIDGITNEYKIYERYFIPSEITWLLKSVGFIKVEIYGNINGAFSRCNKLTPHNHEMLIIAHK